MQKSKHRPLPDAQTATRSCWRMTPVWKWMPLNGEPGVYSARYMGEDTSYRIKNQSLVDRLEGVPVEKRTARFVCVIAAAFPDGTVCTTKGTIEGKIGYEERGENGFWL